MGPRVREPTTHPELCLAGLDKAGPAGQFGFLWAELGWLGKAGPQVYCTVLYFVCLATRYPISITYGRDKPRPLVHPNPGLKVIWPPPRRHADP